MTKEEREVMRMALEALEDLGMKHFESTGEVLYKETFTAIKEALAQPEQEPVAWAENDGEGNVLWNRESCFSDDPEWLDNPMPLYTTPPQRKPLTMIEQVDAAMVATKHIHPPITRSQCELIIRAAAHGIKE